MNAKIKRAIAIIALILMVVFSVALIMYLFDKTLLNGAVGDLALWSGGFGLLLFIVLWISHSFPSQEEKDKERDKLYKEAEEMDKKERGDDENDEEGGEENEETSDENGDVSPADNPQNEHSD